jgi:tol-pal system protein YbgF
MKKKVLASLLVIAAVALPSTAPQAAQLFPWLSGNQPVNQAKSPVILAQAADAEMRIQQLEEQLRQLNGRVEDMSYQLLQMQEQLRKTQEDNEFRFQQLEGGKTKKKSSLETTPGSTTQDTASGDQTPGATLDSTDNSAATDGTATDDSNSASTDDTTGKPPVTLGQLNVDSNGNVIAAEPGADNAVDETNLPPPGSKDTSTDTASADATAPSGDEYDQAYQHVLAGDYAAAETGFAAFITNNQGSKKLADANFWLGESQYSQGKFSDSAKTFLNAYKTYGKSAKAPEMLLKLAMSLAKLDSKDTACATLREVPKAYPKASRAVINKVASEQKRLAC